MLAAAAMRIVREGHDRQAQASEALALFRELEDPRGIAWTLEVLAGLRAAEGRDDSAARLWSASEALRERLGAALPPNLKMLRDRYIDSVRTSLGEVQFARASADGRAISLGDAIAIAQSQALQL